MRNLLEYALPDSRRKKTDWFLVVGGTVILLACATVFGFLVMSHLMRWDDV